MSEELISKKELLEKYNISYGALYRWKRKGLIPEDWFIRRSTVTGQETFFVRAQITERVEAILAGKDEAATLEEMAKKFGATPERDSRRLRFQMKYGEKCITISDIQTVTLEGEAEEKIDITAQLMELLSQN